MKPVISIFFALLVLLTNMSLSLATHYCGGEPVLQEISFGEGDLSCGMVQEEQELCAASEQNLRFRTIPCCEDHQIFWDVNDRYNPESADIIPQYFEQSFVRSVFKIPALLIKSDFSILKKPDPPRISLRILNQVFRI